MNQLVSFVAALLFLVPQISSHVTTTISGKILDREGKPMANAVVVYTDTTLGRVYQLKTDKKGEFYALGVVAGYYTIEITAPDGTHVYSGTRSIGTDQNPNPQPLKTNVLNVDLSTVNTKGELANTTGTTNMSEAEINAIRKENAGTLTINQLVPQVHVAVAARDWPRAISILQQLIAADPNRWEYYQNLGVIQTNASQYEAAVQTLEKALVLARKAMTSTPSPEARTKLSGMLIALAEAYEHLGLLDEATARYNQAAAMASQPALAHFYACNALRNGGKPEAATHECDQAIAADPKQWEPYQAKALAENELDKYEAAIATYDAGIQAARAAIDSNLRPEKTKAGLGQMLSAEASAYLQLQQPDKAIPLFTQAAEVSSYPALPYFNLCAMLYNRYNSEGALPACDKAIASDPTMADAYFVKATILFGKGKLEQGKYQVPGGTREALTKYLELSPQGRHAADVRAMLEQIGARIETTYNPKSK
jgi:tetratricopeptide (TPR) repeat protein